MKLREIEKSVCGQLACTQDVPACPYLGLDDRCCSCSWWTVWGGPRSPGGCSGGCHLAWFYQGLGHASGPLCFLLLGGMRMRSSRGRADAPSGPIPQALIVGSGDCLRQQFLSTSPCCWLPVSAAPKPFVDSGRGCHGAGSTSGKGNRLLTEQGVWCYWLGLAWRDFDSLSYLMSSQFSLIFSLVPLNILCS